MSPYITPTSLQLTLFQTESYMISQMGAHNNNQGLQMKSSYVNVI